MGQNENQRRRLIEIAVTARQFFPGFFKKTFLKIYFLSPLILWDVEALEPIPASLGQRAGYTLNKLTNYLRGPIFKIFVWNKSLPAPGLKKDNSNTTFWDDSFCLPFVWELDDLKCEIQTLYSAQVKLTPFYKRRRKLRPEMIWPWRKEGSLRIYSMLQYPHKFMSVIRYKQKHA